MTRRRLLLAAAAALLAVHLAALWLAAHPRVSRLYRLYYIEHELPDWNHGRGPAVEPGQVIDFRRPQPLLSRRGWGGAESWATWSTGSQAQIYALLPAGHRAQRVTLDVVPFVAAAKGLPAQRVQVSANGQTLGEFRIEAPQKLVLNLPPSVWDGAEGLLRLDFHFPDAAAPQALGQGEDRRMLALALLSMVAD
jgi:hypothetical protein